ncbi:MAG: SAM-dependent methyltransferase [Solirubrobacteraceae bacterium]
MTDGAGSPMQLWAIGTVQSSLRDPAVAPRQGDEGGPEAVLVFDEDLLAAASDLGPGAEVFVLTLLHLARRDVLRAHPRDNPDNPMLGVFSTRSQDRPNPIGLHRVTVVQADRNRVRVRNLEAVDGTPIVDVKPVLRPDGR